MKNIFLMILMCFASTLAISESVTKSEWTSLSQVADEDFFGDSKPKMHNKVFFKLPFQKSGNIVRVITLIDNDFGGFSRKEFSEIYTSEYDCKNKLVRSVSNVTYTGQMGTGAIFKTLDFKGDFSPVKTTYSKKEFEIACNNPKTK